MAVALRSGTGAAAEGATGELRLEVGADRALTAVVLTLDFPPTASAPTPAPFVGTRWGTDIGWPQCGHALPGMAVDFTVVQVTAGRPGTVSPCLREQVAWARSVRSVKRRPNRRWAHSNAAATIAGSGK